MQEVPIICTHCFEENMVDIGKLIRRKQDKLRDSLGFLCAGCDRFVHVFTTTKSLDRAFERLNNRPIYSRNYMFHFARVMKKAEGIQEIDGSIRN